MRTKAIAHYCEHLYLQSINALPRQSHMHSSNIIQLFPPIDANEHPLERSLKLGYILGIGDINSNTLFITGRSLAL